MPAFRLKPCCKKCAAQRTGDGGGFSLGAAFSAAGTPTDAQAIVQGFAAPGALSVNAQGAMGAFESGELDVPDLASVVAGAGQMGGTLGNPFLSGIPAEAMGVFGAIFAAQPAFGAVLGGLAIATTLLTATFDMLGWDARGVTTPSCGNINLNSPIPAGPNDAAWSPYPWRPGHELQTYVAPDGTAYTTSFPSSPDQSNDTNADLWAEFQAADPGSFRRFCYAALLENAALQWNCQANAVNEQTVILHCVEEWNAWHPSVPALDYAIPAYEGALGWNYVAPIELWLGRNPWTHGSAGDQLIHGGPLAQPVTAPQIVESNRTASNLARVASGPFVPFAVAPPPAPAQVSTVHAAQSGDTSAQAYVQAVKLCAQAGDPKCQAELAGLMSAERALEKTVGYWVDYWTTPKAKRGVLLEEQAYTVSQDKVQQLAGALPVGLVHAARMTRRLPR